MFLKGLNKYKNTIGVKLTLWYSCFFILTVSFLFVLAYYFLSQTLRHDDHVAIKSHLKEVVTEYASGGLSQVKRELLISKEYRKKSPFFFRFASPHNNTIRILFYQQWSEFELAHLETVFPGSREWIQIPAQADQGDYSLEVTSARLPDGSWLQVGMSTEARQRVLDQFWKTFMNVALFLILASLVCGYFLSQKALRPIRHLIQTVQSIEAGRMDARVPQTQSQDELGELVRLFNTMLARIQTLVDGMKESLDNVAHELRTPMTRMHNIAEVALRSGEDAGTYRTALQDFAEESNRLLKMLNTLMDISEAETGVMDLDQSEFQLKDMVYPVVEVYEYVAEDKGLRIYADVEEDLKIKGDFNRLSQVIANLLDNAIKYTPDRSGHIMIKAWKEEQEAIISVTDSGQGIAQDELPRIWDRLYRIAGEHHDTRKGLGLGLAQVKAIVQAHNGWVDVSSQPEKGSTFRIHLPQ
jgi:signal transduction histidine kinase